jgi:four helix bundle protein
MNICIYALTQTFPENESNVLASQLRCASDSAEISIAEGIEFKGRMTDSKFRKLPGIAQDSLHEVQTHLLVARRLKMDDEEMLNKAEALCIETSEMLSAFNRY